MVNMERLAETFTYMVGIDSVSKSEGNIARALKEILETMGADVFMDDAGSRTGSNAGNLIARIKGNRDVSPLLLNAHMDTVGPGNGIRPVFKDGTFTSDGTTILGADDKSAIAILLEAIRVVKERNLPHGPIELVLTICEETGLQGAKNLDYDLISAAYGFALDATDTEGIITRAPGANRLELNIHGKDAHAGAAPEKGINAIWLAGKAIAGLKIGRIDRETTCNIGMIEGGTAINIVPKLVTVKGEVRSHDEEKLKSITDDIISSFKRTVADYRPLNDEGLPRLEVSVEHDFSCTHVPDDHPVVVLAQKAAKNLGRKMVAKSTGGGADANIFFQKGIVTGVLGTGMRDMHTLRESIKLDDMVQATELIIEIIKLHAAGEGR